MLHLARSAAGVAAVLLAATSAAATPPSGDFHVAAPYAAPVVEAAPAVGKLSSMTPVQRAMAETVLEPVKATVRAQLLKPETARFSDLRAGVLRSRRVICGIVTAQDRDGGSASERFIATAAGATFETSVPREQFDAGWTGVGCG